MADLDDFFNKRDKKKKTKSKFVTLDTEEFAKQLEANTIKTIEDDAEFQENGELTSTGGNVGGENVDEEWKPFDSEENKDYTGLRIKIQNWKVDDEENNNEGVDVEQEKKVACPWGVSSSGNKQEEQEKQEEETKVEEPVKEEVPETNDEPEPAPASTTSSYVPPHLRRQQQAPSQPAAETKSTAYVPPSMRKTQDAAPVPRRPKVQPNIMDTFEFPTLNSASVETPEVKTNGGEK